MARKKWEAKTEITPALLKFREKRKWQITLRRYVIERALCTEYAPYFGLDIETMRQWFEYQFKEGMEWGNFGTNWQFEHVIPVTYFDYSRKSDLLLCWNFTNIRVEQLQKSKDRAARLDVLAAKNYFKDLYAKTSYSPCLKLLHKIDEIEHSEIVSTERQQTFIREHREYLDMIENYTAFEFELLNSGRSIEEVKKEIVFLKKFKN